ncbi:ABC transporter ATP-binding protein/permease [Siccirubricoccus deserti]|uniref:ABC transporter ATP-binding protein n=1 Tax=Siccirubricoccus deserti TaxID=2013562 RepID=A0A9X0UEF9_9PROT|nr:ABC transporter ATP-binding protein [Siccirubricoccus deserti]MBC4017577.1 ABC transporter ATP-binding protein [Siccirubricoccus deserti]GGC60255.1 ABC transporter ATP-binding protein/permease [Siccirubricoccus deserti]
MPFRLFERLVDPVAAPGTRAARLFGTPVPDAPPPRTLAGFYWHFITQAKALFAALFFAGLAVALLDAAIPVMIGRLVSLLGSYPPDTLWAEAWPSLLGMGAILLFGRPLAIATQNLITQQGINGNVTSMIRWQSHWQVVRQGLPFFQEDFSGRIANRVMQAGPALRETVVQVVNAVWYILVYGTAALGLLASADWRLALPIAVWFLLYAALLRVLVPRMRDRSREASAQRSLLTGRIVDSYTNIQTVKLFARAEQEDAFVREGLLGLNAAFLRQMRLVTLNGFLLSTLNASMLTATGAMAIFLWTRGEIGLGVVATALPMAWQIANISGWVAFNVTAIFENLGVVQEAMGSIAVPPTAPDPPGAVPLRVNRGEIRFERVRFGYGRDTGVLQDLNLRVAPGERVGLVGHSGAGKSTLVNLLLGFFRPEAGRILVDGQDIAGVTQESLRAAIGVVTQDTALLHRSIRENIRYGRPEADMAEVEAAAARAAADGFIGTLEDWRGRAGYDAHVGERGVKLSGGQRQRIAIARVLLKDAPILVLDEATSALDSEVEAVIQDQLAELMAGKTVIAIAHRLSTIARMDRLVVLDHGRIVEEGTHEDLLRRGGVYARLWRQQSGAFEDA